MAYDKAGNVVSPSDWTGALAISGNCVLCKNNQVTIPSSAVYIKFYMAANYGSTYNHDLCINISDTSRNGEYEPYEEHSVSLPVTTITGKLNGEGESVVVFPDGMKSAGTAYDEIYTVGDKTYAVKRVSSYTFNENSINFVSLNNWQPTETTYAIAFKYSMVKDIGVIYNVITTKMAELECIRYGLIYNGKNGIGTFNSDYSFFVRLPKSIASSKDAICDWLNGKTIYYQIASPQVYELDTFDLPKPYQVDGNGTEEQIQKSGVQGLAAILTVLYGVDAVGILNKLPQNYISEASMDNFLAQLNTVTGGTWTKTWNENTGEWDFSFTANAQTNDTNTDETI